MPLKGEAMIKDSTILFLGAGQIGCAACVEILKREPRKLILHTLTLKEANDSLAWIKQNSPQAQAELVPSYGDIVNAFPGSDEASQLAELKYRFGMLTQDTISASPLWKLIEQHQPDLIVDGINTATFVGYGHDPYSTSREMLQILETSDLPDSKALINLLKKSLLSEAIPQLIRFTQVLHLAMLNFNVKRYVKISTSGLGGMGFNIPYTHGDLGESGCSPKLLGKVTAAGILNMLLWTLSHTPGLDVKVIVPIALVGWKETTTRLTQKVNGAICDIPLVDCAQPLDLSSDAALLAHRPKDLGKKLEMVVVDSGENGYYAIGDMTTITTLGQMGCITKEEVGFAIVDSLEGSTRHDVCGALDSACLGPSFTAACKRHDLLTEMLRQDREMEFRSVSTGNLGPTVTKHLWELEILRLIGTSMKNIVNSEAEALAARAEQLILQPDSRLRQQILSLQMPILLEGNRLLLGAGWRVPEEKNLQTMQAGIKQNLEAWAQQGWVDLRASRINEWRAQLWQVDDAICECRKLPTRGPGFNYRSIATEGDFNVGEVLGAIYSLSGGNRKLC